MPSLIVAGMYSMFVTNLPATAQVRPAEIFTRHFAYGNPFRSHRVTEIIVLRAQPGYEFEGTHWAMSLDDAPANFVSVATTGVLTSDGIHPCQVGSKRVLLCRHAGQWYAVDPLCTHAGAPLEGGRLLRGKIVCPLHGAAFDLATGAAMSPPAFRPLATYKLRIVDHKIEDAI